MGNNLRQKMPVSERAKQFMPFAALKGFPEALAQVEQAHTATAKKELSEEMAAELNTSLLSLHPGCQAATRDYKAGHEQQITGIVTKLDATFRYLLVDGTLRIAFDDLLQVERV